MCDFLNYSIVKKLPNIGERALIKYLSQISYLILSEGKSESAFEIDWILKVLKLPIFELRKNNLDI